MGNYLSSSSSYVDEITSNNHNDVPHNHPQTQPVNRFSDYAVDSIMSASELLSLSKQVQLEYPFLEDLLFKESIIITDGERDNVIIYANEKFAQVSGYPKEKIMGINCRFLQGPYTNPRTVDKIRKSIREGIPLDVEILNYRKDGVAFWNNLMMLPVHQSGMTTGTVRYFIGIQKDITTLKYNTDPKNWTAPEVGMFMERNNFAKYSKAFMVNDIYGEKLFSYPEFDFVHDVDKEPMNQLITMLKQNPIEYFDDEKKKLADIAIDFRFHGDFPTADQIASKTIWNRQAKTLPKLADIWITDSKSYPLKSLTPVQKHGAIENVVLLGAGYIALSFKNDDNVYAVYNVLTDTWREPDNIVSERVKFCAKYPHFVTLHEKNEKNEQNEPYFVIFNVSTSVCERRVLRMMESAQDIQGIWCNDEVMVFCAEGQLFKSSYGVNSWEEIRVNKPLNITLPKGKKSTMSYLKEDTLFLVGTSSVQIINIAEGEVLAEFEIPKSERFLSSSCTGEKLAVTTKNKIYVWSLKSRRPEFYEISQKFVTVTAHVGNKVVACDVAGSLYCYSFPENTYTQTEQQQQVTTIQLTKEKKIDIVIEDFSQSSNEGGYSSISALDQNFFVVSTPKAIEIWDSNAPNQSRPKLKIKMKGIQQTYPSGNGNFYFLLNNWEIVHWNSNFTLNALASNNYTDSNSSNSIETTTKRSEKVDNSEHPVFGGSESDDEILVSVKDGRSSQTNSRTSSPAKRKKGNLRNSSDSDNTESEGPGKSPESPERSPTIARAKASGSPTKPRINVTAKKRNSSKSKLNGSPNITSSQEKLQKREKDNDNDNEGDNYEKGKDKDKKEKGKGKEKGKEKEEQEETEPEREHKDKKEKPLVKSKSTKKIEKSEKNEEVKEDKNEEKKDDNKKEETPEKKDENKLKKANSSKKKRDDTNPKKSREEQKELKKEDKKEDDKDKNNNDKKDDKKDDKKEDEKEEGMASKDWKAQSPSKVRRVKSKGSEEKIKKMKSDKDNN